MEGAERLRALLLLLVVAVRVAGRGGGGGAGPDEKAAAGRPFEFLERAAARDFVVASMVEVRLVGFRDGRGGGAARLDEKLLQERLHALRTDFFRAHTVEPMPRYRSSVDEGGGGRGLGTGDVGDGHDLDVRHPMMFRVVHTEAPEVVTPPAAAAAAAAASESAVGVPPSSASNYGYSGDTLLQRLQSMIRKRVFDNSESFLPVNATDNFVKEHYDKTSSHGAYVIYLLNPHVPAVRVGRAYADDDDDGDDLGQNSAPAGWHRPVYWYVDSDESQCGMQSWVGAQRRYAWIDLAAGPSEYGPRMMGDGGVASGSIPRCIPLSAGPDSSSPKPRTLGGGFAARLATTVWRTVQHVFLPSLARLPDLLRLQSGLTNHLRHVVIDIKEIVSHGDEADGGSGSTNDSEDRQRWDDLARSLESLSLGARQRVHVRYEQIDVEQCKVCISALSQSLRPYTKVTGAYGSRASHYIDALELRRQLVQLESRLSSENVGPESDDAAEETTSSTYPVYVYNLPNLIRNLISNKLSSAFPILLDGVERAVAFDDMALAVRSSLRPHKLDHHCNGKQQYHQGRARDLRRDVLGVILSGVWGVAPTHVRWDPLSGGIDVDWLWGASNTPFGPYSSPSLTSLQSSSIKKGRHDPVHFSFVQRDAAHRNQIYATVQAILDDVRAGFLNLSAAVGKNVRSDHSSVRPQPSALLRRSRVMKELYMVVQEELDHAATYVSILDFSHAMEYVLRARDSADSLLVELRGLARSMKPSVDCAR